MVHRRDFVWCYYSQRLKVTSDSEIRCQSLPEYFEVTFLHQTCFAMAPIVVLMDEYACVPSTHFLYFQKSRVTTMIMRSRDKIATLCESE